MSENKNSEDQFTRKVCDIPSDSDSEELRILSNNPSYVCMDCGRSAARSENLCKPEKMFSAW